MEWTEIIMKVPSAQLEQAADMAQMAVDGGIYVEDYSHLEEEAREIAHIDLIDEELLAKDREHGLVHLYISPEENPKEALAFLRERCAGEGIDCEFSVESCAEEDWINNWKQYFHPIPVGEKLLIRPTWEEAYDPQGRTVLHLEPGLAFGTGTHETTRLCLELLEKYLKPGMSLLDVGCGSGILSIAALVLGAERASAVDIDPKAVDVAYEKASAAAGVKEQPKKEDNFEYFVADVDLTEEKPKKKKAEPVIEEEDDEDEEEYSDEDNEDEEYDDDDEEYDDEDDEDRYDWDLEDDGRKMIIIGAVVAVILCVVIGLGAMWFMGRNKSDSDSAASSQTEEQQEDAAADLVIKGDGDTSDDAEPAEETDAEETEETEEAAPEEEEAEPEEPQTVTMKVNASSLNVRSEDRKSVV